MWYLALESAQKFQYGEYGTFRRDLGCAQRKFDVSSVQWLASGLFKCAHLETFQIRLVGSGGGAGGFSPP